MCENADCYSPVALTRPRLNNGYIEHKFTPSLSPNNVVSFGIISVSKDLVLKTSTGGCPTTLAEITGDPEFTLQFIGNAPASKTFYLKWYEYRHTTSPIYIILSVIYCRYSKHPLCLILFEDTTPVQVFYHGVGTGGNGFDKSIEIQNLPSQSQLVEGCAKACGLCAGTQV